MLRSKDWKETVARYDEPVLRKSIWQLVNTLVAFVFLFGLMFWTLEISYWLTLAVAPFTAGFMIRLFIIFHDCSHGSFFKSPRANHCIGFITGVLTFTPYQQWRHKHVLHHATSGDLDGRGIGDVWTLTVREYLAASGWKRLGYRLFRNPVVLFVLAPLYYFLIHQRFPSPGIGRRERRGVHWTNGAIVAIAVAIICVVGAKAYLLVQLPVMMMTGTVGVWLFYVQHQFDSVYWERRKDWRFAEAALYGSSFYKLPKVLQWFTGNIGFHHVHHLGPGIPNYNLAKCHSENALFHRAKAITLWAGMRSISLRLWDEQQKTLVGYWRLRDIRDHKSPTG